MRRSARQPFATLLALLPAGLALAAETPADALSFYATLYARDRGFVPGATAASERSVVSLASAPAPARGSAEWLSHGRSAEPLAATYDAPHSPRRDIGFSYSSEGRLDAHLGAREHGPVGDSEATDCCYARHGAPDSARYGPGGDAHAGSSVLGRLKSRGLRLNLDDGWNVSAGARTREYLDPSLKSRVAHVTLQRWWGEWRTGYAFQIEKRGGWTLAPSQSLQLDYALAPRSVVGVAYTIGQEIAFFGGLGMLRSEVRGLALHGEHAVRKNWSLKMQAGYWDHGDLPTHKSIRFAFRYSM